MLWMAARPGEPSWDGASLGEGRPGWHIECVAIALDHLGMGFDIQGGGSDLAFPHHEMGASHAQALTGEHPFAKVYVHAGMVGLDGEKMSKSRGNLVFVSALRREGVDPAALRLALLSHHYRSDWEWTDQVLADAVERLARWRAAVCAPTGGRPTRWSRRSARPSPTTWTRPRRSPRWTAGPSCRADLPKGTGSTTGAAAPTKAPPPSTPTAPRSTPCPSS
ncbi:L-cysteine:1D-myo-inositol 2-amino-2-deoxy-alpha-D-glucopyranoside ligase [Streptomyces microflavus]